MWLCCLLAFATSWGVPAARAQGAAPPNDNLSSATVLTNLYGGTFFDDNFNATKEQGFGFREPNHSGNPGGASVWYQWSPPVSGVATLQLSAFSFRQTNLIAVYTGIVGSSRFFNSSLTGLVTSNAVPGGFTNTLSFPVTNGINYLIAIDGFNNGLTTNTGQFQIDYGVVDNDSLTNSRPLLGSLGKTSFSNFGATNEVGEPSHGGTNDPGGASVWFAWTARLSGPATFSVSPFVNVLDIFGGSFSSSILMAAYTNNSGTTNLSVTALGLITNNLTTNLRDHWCRHGTARRPRSSRQNC